MSDALLAGLPRIVRASDEISQRGVLAIAVAVSAAVWWVLQWLLDQPLEARQTGLLLIVVGVLATVAAWVNSSRRAADGLIATRRLRYAAAVFMTAVLVLVSDVLIEWGGVTAGVIAGAGLAVGIVDLVEARRWERAERRREAELLVLIRPKALVASYGEAVIFEVPHGTPTSRPEIDL